MAITAMKQPEKSGGSAEDMLKTTVNVAASSAGRFFRRLREEYRAGLAGDSKTAQSPPPPSQPPPPAGDRPKSRRWWEVLGVSETAGLADIATAYRELMRTSHPDKVAQLSDRLRQVAEEESQQLNAAYEEARRIAARQQEH